MIVEISLVILYLLACIGVGVIASRRAAPSLRAYWVHEGRLGIAVNSLAILAGFASGGSVIGVVGLAYSKGIPLTLSLFAGAAVGFPLAAILVAAPLRRFAGITLTDFLRFRFPHVIVRTSVPLLVVVSSTIYLVAQLKVVGIVGQELLGVPYAVSITVAMGVFVLYVSIGGMVAVTWTDVFQGLLMLAIVGGVCFFTILQTGQPGELLEQATRQDAQLGASSQSILGIVGPFVLWATAIPVMPHIVMRINCARNALAAKVSLNLAMVVYSLMIVACVMIIVPFAKMELGPVSDNDTVFLRVVDQLGMNPWVRGIVAVGILAAVMSTVDSLLLASAAAISHDLLGDRFGHSQRGRGAMLRITVVWLIGIVALALAYTPPKLIVDYYTTGIGLLSASLLVPTLAGFWWKRATTGGAIGAIITGMVVYIGGSLPVFDLPKHSQILLALPASAAAMILISVASRAVDSSILKAVAKLHQEGSGPSEGTGDGAE